MNKVIFFCFAACLFYCSSVNALQWHINTSNQGKLEEFQRIFAKYDAEIDSTEYDLEEIDADPVSVAAHKASHVDPYVLIEDTSLDIEGADVGVNIKWVIDHLSEYENHKAVWTVMLAYRRGDAVFIYKGEVAGTIVAKKGQGGFGFDPYFKPNGSSKTLAEYKPDDFNARALAVDALFGNKLFAVVAAIYDWEGPWQNH